MKIMMMGIAMLLASVGPSAAQGVVNPSTASWTAPTANTDGSPLTDLASYNLRVAGPFTVGTACPAYAPGAYPTKRTVASTTPSPAPSTTVTYGTPGARALAADLGLTADGTYCIAVTAVDTVANESGGSNAFPFERNSVPSNAPSDTRVSP